MGRIDLPALHLVLAFEAAARHHSFKKAAEELGVTPSAVSQRIRQLEDYLGFDVFVRVVRGIELTPEGTRYLVEVQRLVTDFVATTQRFVRPLDTAFTLAMNSMMAHEVVIPNLALFKQRVRGGGVEVVTRPSMKSFKRHDADAGVRIGAGSWPGFEERIVGPLRTLPACAPSVAGDIRDWDDFFDHTLFCAGSRRPETLEALRHPVTGRYHPKVVQFQTMVEATRAAESGLGVIGGFFPLMGNLILQGRLVIVLPDSRPVQEWAFFIHRPDHPAYSGLEAVYDCLVECYGSLPQSWSDDTAH